MVRCTKRLIFGLIHRVASKCSAFPENCSALPPASVSSAGTPHRPRQLALVLAATESLVPGQKAFRRVVSTVLRVDTTEDQFADCPPRETVEARLVNFLSRHLDSVLVRQTRRIATVGFSLATSVRPFCPQLSIRAKSSQDQRRRMVTQFRRLSRRLSAGWSRRVLVHPEYLRRATYPLRKKHI